MARPRIRVSRPRVRITPQPTTLTLLDCIADPLLFAPWFKDPATWTAWFAFIAALFALPMTADQLAIYRQCTGRDDPPSEQASEAWLVCGRRAGKSFVLALIAVFLACFHDYRRYLAPGERGTVFIIATDRKQARIILRYIRALLTNVPMLSRMIEREWAEGFDLSNSVTIEVATASFRSTRGFTLVACLLDELAFWPTDDTATPDVEVLNALRPGMATIPNAMLLCASSPYARRGALWDAYRRHYGKPGSPVTVWKAPTRAMNGTVSQAVIDAAYEADPASAAAEYGAEFRSDVEAFIAREAIEACITPGCRERERVPGLRYSAFLDPAGGSGKDSFTLAIAHKEDGIAVLDAIRERKPPFSPEAVVSDYAAVLKSYGVSKVVGDRFAGEWVREPFKVHGISYAPSAKPKSDLYRDALPLINSRKCELLDDAKLLSQFVGLERRTARSGRDSIDHAPNAHDDLCNVVAGVLVHCTARTGSYDSTLSWVGDLNPREARILELKRFMLTGGLFR